MNRRSFLLSLGMMACSGSATTTTMRPRKHKPRSTPTNDAGLVNVDLVWLSSQRSANRLAFHGDVLVQSVNDELRGYNATTMRNTDTWALPNRHFCFAQDGTIVAFGFPRDAASSVIHRIAKGTVESIAAPPLPNSGTNVVLPGATPDELYVTVGENIYLLRRDGNTFEAEAILKHPAPTDASRDQWISRGDGRIIGLDREHGLHLLAPNNVSSAYRTPNRDLLHLAAATRDRAWYTYAEIVEHAELWNVHTLILAPVDKPMSAERTIDVAPARIIHIASHGDTLAALLFTARAIDDMTWSVAVFDETGKERWRTDVPPDLFQPRGVLNNAFIAIGEHRVAVASFDGKLVGWDAANGKLVGS